MFIYMMGFSQNRCYHFTKSEVLGIKISAIIKIDIYVVLFVCVCLDLKIG